MNLLFFKISNIFFLNFFYHLTPPPSTSNSTKTRKALLKLAPELPQKAPFHPRWPHYRTILSQLSVASCSCCCFFGWKTWSSSSSFQRVAFFPVWFLSGAAKLLGRGKFWLCTARKQPIQPGRRLIVIVFGSLENCCFGGLEAWRLKNSAIKCWGS